MISSPGCLCLTDGASGLSSTRFWMTRRPGTLRSCCCRSLRQSPGACWTGALIATPVVSEPTKTARWRPLATDATGTTIPPAISGLRTVGALGFGQPGSDAIDAVSVARMVAEELRRLLPLRRAQHPLPERERLVRVVARPGHVDEPDVVGFGFLRAAERKRRAGAHERLDADELSGGEGDAAGEDRGRDGGQVLALDPLGDVLRGRVRDLVAEDGRKAGVVLRDWQDAGVDDDLAAGQAVGVGDVLAEERHLPDEVGLVAPGDGLDALRDPLDAGVVRAGRDDVRPVLPERLRVVLVAELRLLCVGERDMHRAVGHWCLVAPGLEEQHADYHGCDRD